MLDLRTITGAMLASQTGLSASTMLFLIVIIIVVLLLMHHSAKKDEKQTQEALQQMSNPPEHMIVSGSPSLGTVATCVILVIVLCIVATHGL